MKCGYDFVIPLLVEGNGTEEELLSDPSNDNFQSILSICPIQVSCSVSPMKKLKQ